MTMHYMNFILHLISLDWCFAGWQLHALCGRQQAKEIAIIRTFRLSIFTCIKNPKSWPIAIFQCTHTRKQNCNEAKTDIILKLCHQSRRSFGMLLFRATHNNINKNKIILKMKKNTHGMAMLCLWHGGISKMCTQYWSTLQDADTHTHTQQHTSTKYQSKTMASE